MHLGRSLRRAGTCPPVALLLASLLSPAFAPAAVGRPSDGDLSPRLAELAKPTVRAAPIAEQARELGVARRGPGSLLREGNRVLVEVRYERGAVAGVDDLRAAGAKIVHVSPRHQTVTVAARPGELRRLSRVPRVLGATEVLTPIVHATGDPGPAASASAPCFGAATSEGDEQLGADRARAEFEVDGGGVKVGVLSDSFDRDPEAATGQAADVESGDLPGVGNPCGRESPVQILDDTESEGSDEGRAMAQIVHDLAPGADLAFASAFTGVTGFADNIRALRDEGADVIVDDVSYFVEPFFQEGPVGVAVSEVAESGVAYFSSAGNNNLINEGRDFASWEAAQFRDSGACPAPVVELSEEFEAASEPGLNPSHCMDFDPGAGVDETFGIGVAAGATLIVDLQWAEPWEGVGTDVDVFLIGPGGEVVSGSVGDNVAATQRPFEIMGWENDTGSEADVQLAINRYSGEGPRLKFALLQNGGGVVSTEFESSAGGDVVGPTIFGHNGAEDAISLGAIRYNATSAPERFSSRGPVTHRFGPVDGVVPAAPLEPARTLAKPDLVATDGGANTFFGASVGEGIWRFFGTSASAPHAAAVAALMREADPSLAPDRLRDELASTARPVGEFGPDAIGAGLVDAVGAVGAVAPPPGEEGGGEGELEGEEGGGGGESAEGEVASSSGETASGESAPSLAVADPPAVADRIPPRVFFRRRARKRVLTPFRRGRVVFRLGSDEIGARFICRLGGRRWRFCRRRVVMRLGPGRHVLRVRAVDVAGNVSSSAAVYRFRVKRVRRRPVAS